MIKIKIMIVQTHAQSLYGSHLARDGIPTSVLHRNLLHETDHQTANASVRHLPGRRDSFRPPLNKRRLQRPEACLLAVENREFIC